ncbi:MAG TPA: autotransporter-associated beta strand repeat-containing protein [Verrucomicrobiae bacterium]
MNTLGGSGSAALTDSASAAVTLSVGANNSGSAFTGLLSGNGGLTKLGSATMTMNGASTYTGNTLVSGGILAAVDNVSTGYTAPFGVGNVTVNNGAILELGYGPANAFGTYIISNSVALDNGTLYAFDGSHHVSGNLVINAGGGTVGSTFDAPWEGFTEANFPKSIFFDGLLTGSGNLTVQHTGWNTGNAWDTSCAVFTSQGTAAQNTYSGTVTVNPAGGGGSYLYLVGTNVMANATILLNGDNTTTSPRMGSSTLLFGNGTVDGPGYMTIGGLSGSGNLLLADTILFSGGNGYSTGLPVALTLGYNNISSSYSGILSGAGSLTKIGTGLLSLSGANTYTGNTTLTGGSLVLSGAWLVSTNVTAAAGTTLDVSALGGITLAAYQSLYNAGNLTGSVTTSSGTKIYAGLDGGYGTNAISGDLNLAAGSVTYFDLGTTAAGVNDKITVGGTLTANANVIHIKAASTSVNFDAATDYVLFTSANAIVGSFASAPAWDVPPANAGHYSVVTSGNTVKLHYAAFSGPSALGSTTPATAVRNQKVLISVLATNGNPGTVNSVVVDASQLGGSASLSLVFAGGNLWTNSVTIPASLAAGSKTLAVTVSDSASLSANINITVSVVVGNDVWNGAGGDNNLTSNLNWTNQTAPGNSGDSLEFGGTTRLSPNVDYSFSLTGIAFNSTAGSFNLGTANSSTLTLTANGVVNNSANAQTINVPVALTAAETINAAAGNITLAQPVTKNSNLFTVTGTANTVIAGGITDSGSLFKKGTGNLILSAGTTWDSAQASSGGFSGPLIDQSGTITFNNGSTHAVTGELVIGGVITNGTAGNNAKMVVDGATLNVSSWFSIGRGNGIGAVSSDLVLTNGGTVSAQNVSAGYNGGNSANKPKGSITLSDSSSFTVTGGSLFVGESDGSDITMNLSGNPTIAAGSATMSVGLNSGKGTVNQNGGTVSVGSLNLGSGANASSTASGTYNLNAGTLNSEGDTQLGFAGNGANGEIGKLVLNGGTLNIATATKRWMIISRWDTANSQVDINSGQLNLNAGTDIRYAIGNNSGSNVINLNGGAITFYSDNATTVGGTGVIDLDQGNGSTPKNTFNLNGGTLTTFGIISAANNGTRKFNFNGGTLKGSSSNASFLSLGTGSATANIRSGGAVIDTAGFTLGIPQALLNNGVDADGGLTKNGNGTLILSGANTYTNNTVVNAGTLVLSNAVLSAVGAVKVATGANLNLAFTVTNQVAALWLNGVSQPAGVYNAANASSYLSGTGSLLVASPVANYSTNISFTVSAGVLHITWPTTHLGWILQQQTNTLAAGLSTNWVDVSGSASVTTTNISVNPATPAVYYRLRHP